MIHFSDEATAKIKELMADSERSGKYLRIQIVGRGPQGFRYSLRFVDPSDRQTGDQALDAGGWMVLIDPQSAAKMQGASVEYVSNEYQSGFHINNPNPLFDDPLAQAVQEVIQTKINPGVGGHGGYVTLIDVKDGVAYVALGGGCQGCGLANVTLKQGIDVMIRQSVPQITRVVDTTNHDAGTNPYFRPSKDGPPARGGSPFGG
jgi:Fe/S biogenesis protein NfuA